MASRVADLFKGMESPCIVSVIACIFNPNEGTIVIASFGDQGTEDLYHGRHTSRVRRFPQDIISKALIKLDMLNAAVSIQDLRSPPGNRLEILKADLAGYHSIRVNDQWRVIFRWENGTAYDTKLLDYH